MLASNQEGEKKGKKASTTLFNLMLKLIFDYAPLFGEYDDDDDENEACHMKKGSKQSFLALVKRHITRPHTERFISIKSDVKLTFTL